MDVRCVLATPCHGEESMSDGGKGSAPRPLSVSHDEFASRYDAIFRSASTHALNSANSEEYVKDGQKSMSYRVVNDYTGKVLLTGSFAQCMSAASEWAKLCAPGEFRVEPNPDKKEGA